MKKGFLMTFALLLVAIGAYFVSGTYAKYTESVTKSGDVTVAKWAFGTDNNSTTLDIALSEAYDPSSLVAGKIAPGTRGYFDIALSNATTETAVDVSLAISKDKVPKNLKFYTDNTYTTELGEDTLTAVIAAGGTLENKTIYWKWEYETGSDEATKTTNNGLDTEDGKTADTMTIGLTITGTQKAPTPENTVVTSQWN